jgi:hypothetical protein
MERIAGVILVLVAASRGAMAVEGPREDSILLNGRWEFVLGDGQEEVFRPGDQANLEWRPVNLPGPFVPWSQEAASTIKFVWARRSFQVTSGQADRLAVLRWDRIVHGATAYLNGIRVGHHEPTGPYQALVPAGVLRAGENEIVLKIAGAAGVRKAGSGHFLFPVGQIWGPTRPVMPTLAQDVWIDFADQAYMKWALVIPDIVRGKARIRVTLTGWEPLDDLTVAAEVRPWREGQAIGSGQVAARLVPTNDPLGGEHFFAEVPMDG